MPFLCKRGARYTCGALTMFGRKKKLPPQSMRSAISAAISSMQAPSRLSHRASQRPANDHVYNKSPLYAIHLQTRHGKGAKTPERPPRLQGIGPPRAFKCKRGKPGTDGRRVRRQAGAWTARGRRPDRAPGGDGRRAAMGDGRLWATKGEGRGRNRN